MRDVAERAGVSTTTVSHVINRTRVVSDESRQRVLKAMQELGYQPNALARSLRRKETYAIGVIVPDSADPFYAEVIRGIEDTSFERGYTITLCNSDGDLEKERLYTNMLTERRVDGVLFFAASNQSRKHLQVVLERRVPLVVVDRHIPDIEIDTVLIDNTLGGQLATRHLIELGHRRIACISGPLDIMVSLERVAGFRKALQENGLPLDETLIVVGDGFSYQAGFTAAQNLLAMSRPPTAIFACNDMLAIGAINAAAAAQWQVPTNLSVVGFDDLRVAAYATPPLTTIAQPKYEMGTISTIMLLERINHPDLPARRQLLEIELVIRHSTASTG